MKTITFKNEKGQFSKTNTNNGFVFNYDFFTASCERDGQLAADDSNDVKVKLIIKKIGNPIGFKDKLFNRRLNDYYYGLPQWQYSGEMVLEFIVNAPTWSKAFGKAKDYLFSEVERYEALVSARERALIDAEF